MKRFKDNSHNSIAFEKVVPEVHCYGTHSGLTPEYPIEDNFLINLKFTNGVIARVRSAYGLVDPPMPMMGSLFTARPSPSVTKDTVTRYGYINT